MVSFQLPSTPLLPTLSAFEVARAKVLGNGTNILSADSIRSLANILQFTNWANAATWALPQITTAFVAVYALWYAQRRYRRKGENITWQSTTDKQGNMTAFEDPGICCPICRCEAPIRHAYHIKEIEAVDPGLLKKHSEFRSYTTSRFIYPSLRVFYRRHPQADKLPTTPTALPLLVFIHGLGGSVAQFHPLLTSLVNLSSCLAIDLPGCGLSGFEPTSWDAYESEALAELLSVIIEDYREKDVDQAVVLIGHSMGCSLSALVASRNTTIPGFINDHVVGMIAICPKAEPPTEAQVTTFRRLLMIPGVVFDLWRRWDRRGGADSASVIRFVGADADLETRKLQYKFNDQSRTPVWRRMASGSLPIFAAGKATGGLPGRDIWAGIKVPVFLIAGAADNICKPEEIDKIAEFMGKASPTYSQTNDDSEPITDAAAPVDVSAITNLVTVPTKEIPDEKLSITESNESANIVESSSIASTPTPKPKPLLKSTILPVPANHALLYTPSTVRTLAGLISDFLCTQISPRLSLGWQLQFLSTAGKWDVKNLAKWQAITPVSEPIADIFRAMKTLREVDRSHSPARFVEEWGGEMKDIIDISHESPVYDPRGLENGGIHYHKFPTVSKIPPTSSEVKEFIALVDRLREEEKVRVADEHWEGKYYIGVHCHYGFNRTGYFIVCYLVERCGYSVQKAVDEFKEKRPNGIKHAHFMDQLFVRYCVGLKRAPTF